MDKKMIYLINLIAEMAKKIEIPQTYSNKFRASNNEYLSPTEKIRIDDLVDHYVTAGLVGRDEILPILRNGQFAITEFEPDIIGGQFPYQAIDLLQLSAGIPMITTTGKEIPTIKQLEAKYSRMIAAAINNTFERQCAQAYLKGTYIDKMGEELEVGVKNDTPLSWNSKTKVADELLKLMVGYNTKHGVWPSVEVGETIFNLLKNEANDTRQNINGVRFFFSENPYIEIGGKRIDLLVNAKDSKGATIETKDLMIFNTPSNLGIGYGCLSYGIVATNESKLVRAKLIAGETRVDETSGSKGLWGKSAPIPIILSTKKYIRYKVTIS